MTGWRFDLRGKCLDELVLTEHPQLRHDRTISLRCLSAISSKREQYRRALAAGLVEPDDGYAVAISGSQIPLADLDPEHKYPRIVKALFGIGASTIRPNLGEAQRASFAFY